jgi:hypothetical protein
MKNFILFFCLNLLMVNTKIDAQNAYCDSIAVDSVFIDNNMLQITVYNSSQHFIVYPFFIINLDQNNHIQLNDSVTVLSFLSVMGDANNGYTTASYFGNISAANTVPLNTNFTGTITIIDPNDSTFNCTYPFNFVYGTMPTSIKSTNEVSLNVYPSPASNSLTIQLSDEMINASYLITDQTGRNIASGKFNNALNTIDIKGIETGIYNLTLISNHTINTKVVILKN